MERRKLEEKERQREERRRKAEIEKLKFKCGFAQKRINFFLTKLPANFESEEESKRVKEVEGNTGNSLEENRERGRLTDFDNILI